MDDTIVFSEHSVLRISERTGLSTQDIRTRLTKKIAVLVAETIAEPKSRYQVLWDSTKNKPLLVVLHKLEEALWEVVTVYETMTYHKRADNVMVMPLHIERAQKRETRYINEGHPRGAEGLRGHARLQIIVRSCECGITKVQRYKIGAVPIHEFLSSYGGTAEKLLGHFVQLGKLDHISIQADSTIEAEVVATEDNTRSVLSSWP